MNTETLDTRRQSIVTVSAFTASGDLAELEPALHEGLDAGLTVNEIKEILVQLYAYAGFPRSLNAIQTFMAVMEDRKAKGRKDRTGNDASPLPANMDRDAYGARVRAQLAGLETIPPPSGFQLFAPVIDRFLKEHLFADIFARDNLDYASRELATISALAAMTGTSSQLRFHLGAAMNAGLTRSELQAFVSVLEARVGAEASGRAAQVLHELLRPGKR